MDDNNYENGIKISDDEIANLNIFKDVFHGEWNYIIETNIERKNVD